eukprot:gene19148-biopygen12857
MVFTGLPLPRPPPMGDGLALPDPPRMRMSPPAMWPTLHPPAVLRRTKDAAGAEWVWDGSRCARARPIAAVAATTHAFAAVYADGVIAGAWGGTRAMGHEGYGGALPPALRGMDRVAAVVATAEAFVVVRSDGRLAAWGEPSHGGGLSEPPPRGVRGTPLDGAAGVAEVAASSGAFAALLWNGTVAGAWGLRPEAGATLDK